MPITIVTKKRMKKKQGKSLEFGKDTKKPKADLDQKVLIIKSFSGIPTGWQLPPGFKHGGAWCKINTSDQLEIYLHSNKNSSPEYVLSIGDEIDFDSFNHILRILKSASKRLDDINTRIIKDSAPWSGEETHIL